LHFFGQCMDLAPVLLIGGSDMQRQEMARVSTAMCTLLTSLG
jgi:hypothetical protein